MCAHTFRCVSGPCHDGLSVPGDLVVGSRFRLDEEGPLIEGFPNKAVDSVVPLQSQHTLVHAAVRTNYSLRLVLSLRLLRNGLFSGTDHMAAVKLLIYPLALVLNGFRAIRVNTNEKLERAAVKGIAYLEQTASCAGACSVVFRQREISPQLRGQLMNTTWTKIELSKTHSAWDKNGVLGFSVEVLYHIFITTCQPYYLKGQLMNTTWTKTKLSKTHSAWDKNGVPGFSVEGEGEEVTFPSSGYTPVYSHPSEHTPRDLMGGGVGVFKCHDFVTHGSVDLPSVPGGGTSAPPEPEMEPEEDGNGKVRGWFGEGWGTVGGGKGRIHPSPEMKSGQRSARNTNTLPERDVGWERGRKRWRVTAPVFARSAVSRDRTHDLQNASQTRYCTSKHAHFNRRQREACPLEVAELTLKAARAGIKYTAPPSCSTNQINFPLKGRFIRNRGVFIYSWEDSSDSQPMAENITIYGDRRSGHQFPLGDYKYALNFRPLDQDVGNNVTKRHVFGGARTISSWLPSLSSAVLRSHDESLKHQSAAHFFARPCCCCTRAVMGRPSQWKSASCVLVETAMARVELLQGKLVLAHSCTFSVHAAGASNLRAAYRDFSFRRVEISIVSLRHLPPPSGHSSFERPLLTLLKTPSVRSFRIEVERAWQLLVARLGAGAIKANPRVLSISPNTLHPRPQRGHNTPRANTAVQTSPAGALVYEGPNAARPTGALLGVYLPFGCRVGVVGRDLLDSGSAGRRSGDHDLVVLLAGISSVPREQDGHEPPSSRPYILLHLASRPSSAGDCFNNSRAGSSWSRRPWRSIIDCQPWLLLKGECHRARWNTAPACLRVYTPINTWRRVARTSRCLEMCIAEEFNEHSSDFGRRQQPQGPKGGWAVRLLTSRRGEPGSVPGRVAPGVSQAGTVTDDTAGWRVFSGSSRFPPLAFRCCSILTAHFTLTRSQELVVKSHLNLPTQLNIQQPHD
ncbi:hypothetical protein PR048_027557 [Dryococelus australis]|uniref:Uncharacterized protein n=1 Tax=Dryococelus australis TaxID=614101 RepID=A0ABQ9GGW0_9NEOP|nr:hypothetical protein PR048_027557 [Dryococelus australis]